MKREKKTISSGVEVCCNRHMTILPWDDSVCTLAAALAMGMCAWIPLQLITLIRGELFAQI